ncbi:MAG: nucleoid occlusion factor SlmA [Porticoccaceae bacterium]|nr:nucleoid occlusion factor SlmA [Porticoccaceae bacterium]
MAGKTGNRRQEILQTLARMLEKQNTKITTASLASELDISEAALYRHFPSKAKMFESLIDFAEETIFSRIKSISAESDDSLNKCNRIINLVLNFCSKNPGITRLLIGNSLVSEYESLNTRIKSIHEKLTQNFKAILAVRQNNMDDLIKYSVDDLANLFTNLIEGKINSFVRSDFNKDPLTNFNSQWQMIKDGIE